MPTTTFQFFQFSFIAFLCGMPLGFFLGLVFGFFAKLRSLGSGQERYILS